MNIVCKNCGYEFVGNYCNNCSQQADTHQLSMHHLWHDIQHGLFHVDSGVPFTLLQLFTRPGHAIREYIDGKRVKYFKPLSLVIVLASAYVLLMHFLGIHLIDTANYGKQSIIDLDKFDEWTLSHYAIVSLVLIPFLSIGSYFSFKRQGYNFVEHLVLNAYSASQRLFLSLLFVPMVYFFKGSAFFETMSNFSTIFEFLLIYWCYAQFFNTVNRIKTFFLTILTYIIFFIILSLVYIVVMYFFFHK